MSHLTIKPHYFSEVDIHLPVDPTFPFLKNIKHEINPEINKFCAIQDDNQHIHIQTKWIRLSPDNIKTITKYNLAFISLEREEIENDEKSLDIITRNAKEFLRSYKKAIETKERTRVVSSMQTVTRTKSSCLPFIKPKTYTTIERIPRQETYFQIVDDIKLFPIKNLYFENCRINYSSVWATIDGDPSDIYEFKHSISTRYEYRILYGARLGLFLKNKILYGSIRFLINKIERRLNEQPPSYKEATKE